MILLNALLNICTQQHNNNVEVDLFDKIFPVITSDQIILMRLHTPQAEPRWRIPLENSTQRYFGPREICPSEQRRLLFGKNHQESSRMCNNL